MPDAIAALRQAAEVVRTQIPTGSLTVASVKTLLEAAEMVCEGASLPPARKSAASAARQAKRQEARQRWARIAQENAR